MNRLSLILLLASVGLLFFSAAVEVSGYMMPMEDWFSGFSAYAIIFYVVYRFTRGSSVEITADFQRAASK